MVGTLIINQVAIKSLILRNTFNYYKSIQLQSLTKLTQIEIQDNCFNGRGNAFIIDNLPLLKSILITNNCFSNCSGFTVQNNPYLSSISCVNNCFSKENGIFTVYNNIALSVISILNNSMQNYAINWKSEK